MDHFSGVAKGQRGNAAKRGGDKRGQNKKYETQSEQFDCTDEQVYNKPIEELMDYIC